MPSPLSSVLLAAAAINLGLDEDTISGVLTGAAVAWEVLLTFAAGTDRA